MSSFDKYKLPKNPENIITDTNVNVFDKYRKPKTIDEEQYLLSDDLDDIEESLADRINRYAEEQEAPVTPSYSYEGDEWLPYLGKKTLSTITELPDLVPNVLEIGELALRTPFQYADKTGDFLRKSFDIDLGYKETPWFYKLPRMNAENIGRPSTRIKHYINKLGIPTEVQPKNGLQRIAGHTIDYAAPGGLFGSLSKANKLKNVTKGTLIGADLGTTSGTLQEIGAPPLVSDAIALAANPLKNLAVNKGYNIIEDGILSLYSPYGLGEKRVNKLINNSNLIRRDELDKLINYKPEGDIIPVTAEVAQNSGISNLHNTYTSKFPGIRKKQHANDAIYRSRLDDIGTQAPLTPENTGTHMRDEILYQLDKLKGIRKSETAPLYAALDSSEKLYPVKYFSHYNKGALKKELGETKQTLNKTKSILFNAVKDKIKSKQTKLTNMRKSLLDEETAVSKKISNPSQTTFEQAIPDYSKKKEKITKLEQEIQKEANNFTPGFIDKAITEIGNKSLEFKKSERRGSKNTIRHLENQKKALEDDLLSTMEGAEARRAYAEHSKPINEIEQDKFLQGMLKTDELGNFKLFPERVAKGLSNTSEESSRLLGRLLKDTEAGESVNNYLRSLFTSKAHPNGLPTASASKSHIRNYGKHHRNFMSPENQRLFEEIDAYLQNRALYASGNMVGVGSATAPRGMIEREVAGYIGKPQLKRFPKYLSTARHNEAYTVLEDFLTDPVYAQKILNQTPRMDMKFKPYYKSYGKNSIPPLSYMYLKRED
jgi:hypothetical protein